VYYRPGIDFPRGPHSGGRNTVLDHSHQQRTLASAYSDSEMSGGFHGPSGARLRGNEGQTVGHDLIPDSSETKNPKTGRDSEDRY
jgi:hypothetical protein